MIQDMGRVFDSLYKSRRHNVEISLEGFSEAKNVYVVDDFCCWFPGAQPMKRDGDKWKLSVSLHEGDYRYAFSINGYKWISDPDNPQKAKTPYGLECSLFRVNEKLLTATSTRNDGKIELEGLYHDQTPNFLDRNEDKIFFKFRTKKNDVTNVKLVISSSEKEHKMEKIWEDEYFDYYECSIVPARQPLRYHFKIEDADTLAYFSAAGASTERNAVEEFVLDETLLDAFDVPKWAKEAVFYQIFPERFYNGDRKNDPPAVAKWGDKPTSHNFFGGDLKGIIDKLDQLESLGVDAIYLTPIFCSESNHKYDVYDYFHVDPHFGDNETLKTLVKEAHKRGIKVVLDAVFHHTSDEFWAFSDIIKNQQKSKYADWYLVTRFPVKKRRIARALMRLPFARHLRFLLSKSPPLYETFAGVPFMPKLNLLNHETAEYFMNVTEYWIREAEIDGWRFDVAFGIPHEFWKTLRPRLKKLKPEVYLLGEFGNGNPDPSAWVGIGAFDAVMNYPLRSLILDFVVFENSSANEFCRRLTWLLGKLPRRATYVMYNLLGSHDTPRFLTVCKSDIRKAKLATLLQMTLPGAPAIYYGDEIGMEGENDPDCRRTMPWNTRRWNIEIFEYYKQMIRMRKKHPPLVMGDLRILLKDSEKGVCAFERVYGSDRVVVCVNNSGKEQTVSLDEDGEFSELLTGEKHESYEGVIRLTISAKSGLILASR